MYAKKEKRLKAELKRLRKENNFLRTRLGTKSGSSDPQKSKGYLSYLKERAQSHTVYKATETITRYFSKFRLVALIFKILGLVAIAIEASAFLFAFVILLAIFLPPVLLFFPIILLLSAAKFKRDDAVLFETAKNSAVIIFFLSPQGKYDKGDFFYRNALDFASRGYLVLAVSPYTLSRQGISGQKKYFLNARREGENVFVIRQQYFFHIKRNHLKDDNKKTIYVY